MKKQIQTLKVAAFSAAMMIGGLASAQFDYHNNVNKSATGNAVGHETEATGDYSTAVGDKSVASGSSSLAMGEDNLASGNNSVAIGGSNIASTIGSVAIGWDNYAEDGGAAFGRYNYAMGYGSVAMGFSSIVEEGATGSIAMGQETKVLSGAYNATAIGYKTIAGGRYSTAIGFSTYSDSYANLAFGRYNVGGGNPSSWIATDPLFEIGIGTDVNNRANALTVLKNGNLGIGILNPVEKVEVDGTVKATGFHLAGQTINSWDELGGSPHWNYFESIIESATGNAAGRESEATGDYSTAAGFRSKAQGKYSTALGFECIAEKDYSTAIGYDNKALGVRSISLGAESTVAQGDRSTALGFNSLAFGLKSIAIGSEVQANGINSLAMGTLTKAEGDWSTAMGSSTIAQGKAATATGEGTKAFGDYSFTAGFGSEANGKAAIALGENVIAAQDNTIAMGLNSEASVAGAIVIGPNSKAAQLGTIAIGSTVEATGSYSLGLGNIVYPKGFASVAIGLGDVIEGVASVGIGRDNVTTADSAVAIGVRNIANGAGSVALGYFAKAGAKNTVALGRFTEGLGDPVNWVETDPILEVGIGADEQSRENALTVLKNGKVGIGTSSPDYELHVNGQSFTTDGVWAGSDERFKEGIRTIESASTIVNSLRGTTYSFKTEEFSDRNFSEGTKYGFIAQELEEVLPELVSQDSEGYRAVNYDGVIPVLVEAFKEQSALIESLKEEVAALKGESGSSVIPASREEKTEVIRLEQNAPNPFTESTTIRFSVPASVNQAFIYIYDMNGKQLEVKEIKERGASSVEFSGATLPAGMYMYALVADGRQAEVKKMILTK